MIDANKLILDAIKDAKRIRTAGANSLLAVAIRALDSEVKASLRNISQVLGLHPSVVIAITVAADIADDSESRREFGLALFERIKLNTHSPELTEKGRLMLAHWCLERLLLMKEVLDNDLVDEALKAARHTIQTGESPRRGAVMELQSRAEALQRQEVVGVGAGKKGTKEKLGVSDEQRFQQHSAQAVRALLQGLLEQGKSPHLCTTVAGEVVRALDAGLGFAAAAAFTLELAQHVEADLPREHLRQPPSN